VAHGQHDRALILSGQALWQGVEIAD